MPPKLAATFLPKTRLRGHPGYASQHVLADAPARLPHREGDIALAALHCQCAAAAQQSCASCTKAPVKAAMNTGYHAPAIESATSQEASAYCNQTTEGTRLHTHLLHDFRRPSVIEVRQSADTRDTLHMREKQLHSLLHI
jgi:hypothetical protein